VSFGLDQEVARARVFLKGLGNLIEQYESNPGTQVAAAYVRSLAAVVTEWIAHPADPDLRAEVERRMTEFNELAIQAGVPRISELN